MGNNREVYDSMPGWSQSAVKAYLTCPEYYRRRYVEKTFDDSDTKAFEFGRAVDEYVANKQDFLSTWARVSRRSGRDRELTAAVYDDAVKTGEFVLAQPIFQRMTVGLASQAPLYAEVDGVKLKGLLDYYGVIGKEAWIIDLKTTRSAVWRDFRISMLDYGYLFQLTWYALLAKLQGNVDKVRVFIAAVDDSCFSFYEFTSDLLHVETERVVETIKKLREPNENYVPVHPHICPLNFECPYAKVEDITLIDLPEMQIGEYKKHRFEIPVY